MHRVPPDINAGAITTATQEQKARWQSKVAELGDVPCLVATADATRPSGSRASSFIPHDLRPALQPTMPRLHLTRRRPRHRAYLSPSDDGPAVRRRPRR